MENKSNVTSLYLLVSAVAISPGHEDMFEMAMKFVEGQAEVPVGVGEES